MSLSFKSHTITRQYKTDKGERIVMICFCCKKIVNLIIDHINDLTDIFWTNGELHNRTADSIGKKNEKMRLLKIFFNIRCDQFYFQTHIQKPKSPNKNDKRQMRILFLRIHERCSVTPFRFYLLGFLVPWTWNIKLTFLNDYNNIDK